MMTDEPKSRRSNNDNLLMTVIIHTFDLHVQVVNVTVKTPIVQD